MRKLVPSIDDDRHDCWTYELPDGRRIKLDREQVRRHGAANLARRFGLDPGDEGTALPVFRDGRKVGRLPAGFDPDAARSRNPLYDVRPGDFRLESHGWIAASSLGDGDLEAVVGFERLG